MKVSSHSAIYILPDKVGVIRYPIIVMEEGMIKDPVCGKRINRNKAHIVIEYEKERHYLCCPLCQREFERDPGKYLKKRSEKSRRHNEA